jgi:CheY-like chemotaxis protein
MDTRTENLQGNAVGLSSASYNSSITTLGFRTALVIEESANLRRSIVEHLKNRGWLVHGVRSVHQALPVLQHIPYRLVLMDCESSGMTGVEFARIINKSDNGQGIYLVVLTDSRAGSFAADLTDCGAFLAERSTWRHDLSKCPYIESGENILKRCAL